LIRNQASPVVQTHRQQLPTAEIGTAHQEIPVAQFTPAEMAVLRKSAANWKGTSLPKTIGGKLRLAFQKFLILRKKDGTVSGFGRAGFVLTPMGSGLYTWGEEAQRQAYINW
jgi:hypothetical protein